MYQPKVYIKCLRKMLTSNILSKVSYWNGEYVSMKIQLASNFRVVNVNINRQCKRSHFDIWHTVNLVQLAIVD